MWLLYIPFFLALIIGFFYISFQNEKERILLGGLFALQKNPTKFPEKKAAARRFLFGCRPVTICYFFRPVKSQMSSAQIGS